jgi:murein L,D-transpeptidase YcbB/YkuD
MSSLRSLLPAAVLAAVLPFAARAQTAAPAAFTPQERQAVVETLRADCEPSAAAAQQMDDQGLMRLAVRKAVTDLGRRLDPSDVDHFWAYDPPKHDVPAEMAAARAAGRLGDWLRSLAPADPRYRALIGARCRYQAIEQAGGWASLPAVVKLKEGENRPEVRQLRARLAAEGYLPVHANPSAAFDAHVQRAVRSFQQRHGLAADGVVSSKTVAALNVSPAQRLAQIEANLERWHWLPHRLPADRIEVDVGAAQATLFQAGAPTLPMRAIVGDPRHHSPLFASRMQAVVFNPPWNVPDSIAQKEILPKARRSPGYFAREGFAWVEGRLQQRPGPKNALGFLKFDFPSPFGVYLHDTPARSLFARPVRTLSHGCMRLEKPRELAAVLLGGQGWTPETIDAAIADGSTQRVEIKAGPPLYVIYTTVDIAPDGAVSFRPDPYGWDGKLADALAATEVAQASWLPLASECSAAARH